MGAGVKAHVVADVHRALVQDDDASGGLRGIGNLVLSWDLGFRAVFIGVGPPGGFRGSENLVFSQVLDVPARHLLKNYSFGSLFEFPRGFPGKVLPGAFLEHPLESPGNVAKS